MVGNELINIAKKAIKENPYRTVFECNHKGTNILITKLEDEVRIAYVENNERKLITYDSNDNN